MRFSATTSSTTAATNDNDEMTEESPLLRLSSLSSTTETTAYRRYPTQPRPRTVLAAVLGAVVWIAIAVTVADRPTSRNETTAATRTATGSTLSRSTASVLQVPENVLLFDLWDHWKSHDYEYDDDELEPFPQQQASLATAVHQVWMRQQDKLLNAHILMQDQHIVKTNTDSKNDNKEDTANDWKEQMAEKWNQFETERSDWTQQERSDWKLSVDDWKTRESAWTDQEREEWKQRAEDWKLKERTWWNKTVSTEKEWIHHTQSQLHRLGMLLTSWWQETVENSILTAHHLSNTENVGGQEENAPPPKHHHHQQREDDPDQPQQPDDNSANTADADETTRLQQLQDRFHEWWQQASNADRHWWADTLEAFDKFENKTQVWWDLTKSAVAEKSKHAWNATTNEWSNVAINVASKLQNVRLRHRHDDSSDDGNSTLQDDNSGKHKHHNHHDENDEGIDDDDESWWSATQEWFHEHREATREWFHDHRIIRNRNDWRNGDHNNTDTNHTQDDEEGWWNETMDWFRNHRIIPRNRDYNLTGVDVNDDDYTSLDDSVFNAPLLYLNSTRAYHLIMSFYYGWFDESTDFFSYQQGWDVQINQAYCAVASAAALLNSLVVLPTIIMADTNSFLPVDPVYAPHAYATQMSLLTTNNECVNKHVVVYNDTYNGIFHFPGGLTLHQTSELLKCHLPSFTNLQVTTVYADTITLSQMRRDLQQALADPQSRVLVNFNRPALGQEGGGHFSPVAAYAAHPTDAFLIMDVAKYKYPPFWVPAPRLYKALIQPDKCARWKHDTSPRAFELRHPNSTKAIERAALELKCTTRSRGYIVVHAMDDSTADDNDNDGGEQEGPTTAAAAATTTTGE